MKENLCIIGMMLCGVALGWLGCTIYDCNITIEKSRTLVTSPIRHIREDFSNSVSGWVVQGGTLSVTCGKATP